MKPNVILLCVDALRADALGREVENTPTIVRKLAHGANIYELARRGVVFNQHITEDSWTLPSITTLLTGLHRRTHQCIEPEVRVPNEMPLLPELMKIEGYTTAAFVGGGWIGEKFGLSRGFDLFEEVELVKFRSRRLRRLTFDRSLEAFLREQASVSNERPFFLFLHDYYVHNWFEDVGEEYSPKTFTRTGSVPENVSSCTRAYARRVREMDLFVGKLLEYIRELELNHPTILILTSDHGEAFYDHQGSFHHGGFSKFYDELMRIPLILSGGGIPSRRIDCLTRLRDLAPTILSLAQVNATHMSFDGVDLCPLVFKQTEDLNLIAFTEQVNTVSETHNAIYTAGHWGMLRTKDYKLITNLESGESELYDLKMDPIERKDLSTKEEKVVNKMKRRLRDLLRSKNAIKPEEVDIDVVLRRRLEGLGYL